ncbi:Crp/Fnr family transcriptional regulator [Dichotomicrobium thermohalophilum]|nr:Crp/Fnr family transcriptional regulator [Dichotomicrobium thermohalophilum]
MTEDLSAALAVVAERGWFAGRSPEHRAALAKLVRLRRYNPGEALYHYGDPPNGLFGLVSGALDIVVPRSDGLEVTIHRAEPGFWVGELAIFTNKTRRVSVFAAMPTQTLHIPYTALRQLVRDEPRFYEDFYELVEANFGNALQLLANLTTPTSVGRVASRLLLHDALKPAGASALQISQAKLAELVALSLPTLQRVMRRLQQKGLIELGYGQIRIVDRQGLVALSTGDFPPADPG